MLFLVATVICLSQARIVIKRVIESLQTARLGAGKPLVVTRKVAASRLILFVADLFHPVHGFAVELFLNGDVRHGRGGRRAVPVFLARRKPDHVARPDFFNRPAPALRTVKRLISV